MCHRAAAFVTALALAALGAGCASPSVLSSGQPAGTTGEGPADDPACPATATPAPVVLPGVTAAHRSLDYWLTRTASVADLDEVVLSPGDVADHNRAFEAQGAGPPRLSPYDLLAPLDVAELRRELAERLDFLRERVESGAYVDANGAALPAAEQAPFAALAGDGPPGLSPTLRVALAPIPLRCGPRLPPLYKAPNVDLAFDRNACSTLRPQEPVQVLAAWPAGTLLVRSRYAIGWVADNAPLSAPIPAAHTRAFVHGPHKLPASASVPSDGGGALAVAADALLATDGEDATRAVVATAKGFVRTAPLGDASTRRPLTRRALLEDAFRYLDTPYGWGGQGGGRDCSRFVMDVFARFGLHLPRHSSDQSLAGSYMIDVPGEAAEAERLSILDAASRQGPVLLHFPGHIMLYLGRSQEGTPMGLHAFAEYLQACDGGKERRFTVDRVQVSDLTLGQGTSRRSFLERISRVTLLGKAPGPALAGAAKARPAAPLDAADEATTCADSEEVAVFVSPQAPSTHEPVRVMVTSARDLGPVALWLVAPDGRAVAAETQRLAGPPYGYWASVAAPAAGAWTARIGDGARVEACEKFRVNDRPPGKRAGSGPVWQPRRRWSRATENLYATFVQRLFDYPVNEDRTWKSLQELLVAPSHNLLFNHLGQNEESRMTLQPDCADLPYFLRGYFAWKLGLPFAFRKCNRGGKGRAPSCERDIQSNLIEREGRSDVEAFALFARRTLADGVHSGAGRTGPKQSHTDYYPLPLSREALRPGTVFADPYGHLLIVASWVPQGIGSYGVLVGADAQPDGTVGRRRFWRGSFLFTSDTTEAGAGFKAYRPLVYKSGTVRALSNEQIADRDGMIPFSLQQYEGTTDDFYDRVEALINPRPLAPEGVLETLLDAFAEQARRRTGSVQNAEDYQAKRRRTIDMPRGHSIFETTGAWESYSSPSRDMRLLIAMDTVLGFVEVVRRGPERFGQVPGPGLEAKLAALRAQLDQGLRARSFAYKRSDGSSMSLTLHDLVARRDALEIAYNPNDCPEVRWAAPAGSAEAGTCGRRAPAEQQRRMESYRGWFKERKRPPR